MGRPTVAKPLAKKLIDIDPLTPINYFAAGTVPLMEGRFDLVFELWSKWYELGPDSPISALWYAWPLVWNNKVSEAIGFIDETIEQRASAVEIELMSFLRYALKGERSKALETLTEQTREMVWDDPDGAWIIADFYALVNEREQSLDWLERMVDMGWSNYPLFPEIDPFLKNLRGEERFKQLMEKVKYEWEHFEV